MNFEKQARTKSRSNADAHMRSPNVDTQQNRICQSEFCIIEQAIEDMKLTMFCLSGSIRKRISSAKLWWGSQNDHIYVMCAAYELKMIMTIPLMKDEQLLKKPNFMIILLFQIILNHFRGEIFIAWSIHLDCTHSPSLNRSPKFFKIFC